MIPISLFTTALQTSGSSQPSAPAPLYLDLLKAELSGEPMDRPYSPLLIMKEDAKMGIHLEDSLYAATLRRLQG